MKCFDNSVYVCVCVYDMRGVRGVGGVRCAGSRCGIRRLMSTANRENGDDAASASKEIKIVLSVPQSFKRYYDGSSKWWARGRAAYKQATTEYWKTWINNPYGRKLGKNVATKTLMMLTFSSCGLCRDWIFTWSLQGWTKGCELALIRQTGS